MRVGIVGATGQVGTVMRRILTERRFPVTELRLFTGERSAANLRLYARLGYREAARTPAPAGYALVHLAKPRADPRDTRQGASTDVYGTS